MAADGDPHVPSGDYVFVSYARADQRAAQAIVHMLEQAGFVVWWDALISGGERFGSLIGEALERAKVVVVLWSVNATDSHWVQDEASFGRDHHCLVPLSLDGSQPPIGFRQFQCIDISRGGLRASNPAIQRALRDVAAFMGRPMPAPAPKHRSLDRRTLLVGGAAAGVAVGGLVIWRLALSPQVALANTIAVLPFENLSGEPDKQYLSDGLAAELRARLARNPLLHVVGQVSSNSFRDRSENSRDVSRKLNVANLLDGNVRIADNAIRVAVELIDGASGFSKWSTSFDRPLSNLLALDSDVANAVSAALSSRLGKGDQARSRSGGTTIVGAFDAYLRGKELFDSQKDEASDRAALDYFGQSVQLDPEYAAARAARSRSLAVIANQYASTAIERRRLYGEAVTEARRAIASAEGFADAYAALGYALFYGTLDIAAADAPYEKAHELANGSADVLSLYALYRSRRGQFDRARSAIGRAQTLDPLNPGLFKSAGRIRFASGDYAGAIALARQALEINPAIGGAHGDIGNALLMLGSVDEASAEFAKEKVDLLSIPGKAFVAIRRKDAAAAGQAFKELVAQQGDNGLYQQAQVLAQWGKPEQALDALEHASAEQDSGLVYLLTDPFLNPLHNQARFQALLHKLHFV